MSQRGQMYPLFALMLFAILAISAMAVDIGYYRYQQRLQQSATDSAAMAGVIELPYASSSPSDPPAAAADDASLNGYASPDATVSSDIAYSDSFTGGEPAIQVKITKSYPKWFGAIFGQGTQSITTTAVARLGKVSPLCTQSLATAGPATNDKSTFNGPNCTLKDNYCPNFNSATITAASIQYAGVGCGSTTTSPGSTVTPAPTQVPVATDPCRLITACNYLLDNPPSTTSCLSQTAPNGTVNFSVNAGCYSVLNVTKATGTVTLNAGTYVCNGAWNWSGVHVSSGTGGVTIYMTSACTTLNLNNATITLSAPTTGNTSGMLFFAASNLISASSVPNFNSGTSVLSTGIWYLPGIDLNFNGSTGTYNGGIIANQVNFNNANLTMSPPSNSTFGVGLPVLSE